jgi:hypothetical protein
MPGPACLAPLPLGGEQRGGALIRMEGVRWVALQDMRWVFPPPPNTWAPSDNMRAAPLLLLLLLAGTAHAAQHIVGGTLGWTSLPGVGYPIMTAKVGDSLLFNFTAMHDVWLTSSPEAASSCDFDNATLLADRDGSPFMYALSSVGALGFACATPGHCASGQRLVVAVDNLDAGADAGAEAPRPAVPSPTPAPRQWCDTRWWVLDSCQHICLSVQ